MIVGRYWLVPDNRTTPCSQEASMKRPVSARPHWRISLKQASIACVIASGCSSDLPTVSPDVESPEAHVNGLSAAPAKAKDRPAADPVDAILDRLVPSLDAYGLPIRNALLAFRGSSSDPAAWDALLRILGSMESTLPAEYRADLDAIRLELDAIAPR
jgi:hypothetical protein